MAEGTGVEEFHGGSVVKSLPRIHPSMQDVWVQSLPPKDRLQKEIATHPSILAWKIPWTEESGRLQSMGSQRITHLAPKQQMEVRGVWEGWTSVQRLTPHNQWARSFIDRGRGLHAETAQSALRVISKLVMDGLTKVLLIVSSTVNLWIHGWFVLISLRTILGIVAA